MRNPGSSDAGDARPDRIDVLASAEAGNVGVPADGDDAAVAPAPNQEPDAPEPGVEPPADEIPADEATAPEPPAGEIPTDEPSVDEIPADEPPVHEIDDAAGEADLGAPDSPGDGLLFDPLLSDEPIDLAAVRADDALIDALSGGDLGAAHDLIDPDDPLIAMLAAWAASARPDMEPEPERSRPPLSLVPASDAGTGAADVTPHITAAITAAVTAEAGAPDSSAEAEPPEHGDGPAPLVASAREAGEEPALGTVPGAPGDLPVDSPPAPAAITPAAVRRLVPAPVLGVLDRARTTRRLPGDRPTAYPLRRAAVAIVVAALGVSVAAATGGTAQPGDAGFVVTRVLFSERAKSLVAKQVVAEGLERAQAYIAQGRPELAAEELAAVENHLPDVRDEEGRTLLVGQQEVLANAVALTPPVPPDQSGSATPTPPTTSDVDPDTSILAEAPPVATPPGASGPGGATDVVTSPSEDAATDEASTPGGSVVVPPAAGTSSTPSEIVTSTVSGATDEGTVTAEPTPTESTSGSDGTTTVTATSAPTEPTTTSSTAPPTTSPDASTPPTSTQAPTDGGTVATGSVPAAGGGGAQIAVRPAAHHKPADDAAEARTAGAATSSRHVRAVVPDPVAHPVVVTTVPRPVGTDAGTGPGRAD